MANPPTKPAVDARSPHKVRGDRPALAATLMVFALSLLGLQDSLVKLASAEVSLWQFQLLRSTCNLVLLLVLSRFLWGRTSPLPKRWGAVALRSLFLVGGLWSTDVCWFAALLCAGVVLFVGTGLHQDKGYGWSRHFYICSVPILGVSLVFAVTHWPFLLLDLALVSLLLWAMYERLATAVEGAAHAAMADRVVAKCFFFGVVALSACVRKRECEYRERGWHRAVSGVVLTSPARLSGVPV